MSLPMAGVTQTRPCGNLFDLPQIPLQIMTDHDELLNSLKSSTELREKLAQIYFQSGDNGMPWGKWDPQYQPVGVCKVKPIGPELS